MSKLEQTEYRAMVEKWICEGLPFTEIADRCKSELCLDVSHMTVKRHCDNNAVLVSARASSLNAVANGVTSGELDTLDNARLGIDTGKIPTDPDKVKGFTRDTLSRIYLNQLLIVEYKQQQFMSGQGRYPQNEIAGLKSILSCLGYVSDDKDKSLGEGKS